MAMLVYRRVIFTKTPWVVKFSSLVCLCSKGCIIFDKKLSMIISMCTCSRTPMGMHHLCVPIAKLVLFQSARGPYILVLSSLPLRLDVFFFSENGGVFQCFPADLPCFLREKNTRWWFQIIFFIVTPTWGNDPI